MDIVSISSLIVAIISFCVAAYIGYLQIKQSNRMEAFEKRQDERDEKRHNNVVYAEATRFIQKYSDDSNVADIWLLPLCIAAYKYNPTYPYRREIYREFCGLSEDIQKMILERCHIDIPCNRCDKYYDSCFEKLQAAIEAYCPNDRNIFNDNGKYLERALLHHGKKEVPHIWCDIDIWEQECLNTSVMKCCESANHEYMDYKTHITNLLAYKADQQPISELADEVTSLGTPCGNSDEILICYLCCVIAEYVPCYLNQGHTIYEHVGYVCDYNGKRYMEELFLNALHSISIYGTDVDRKVTPHD